MSKKHLPRAPDFIGPRCIALMLASIALTLVGACQSTPPAIHTAVLLEVGGPIRATDVETLADELLSTLEHPESSVTILLADGPNGDVFGYLQLPGMNPDGTLDSDAANTHARQTALAAIEADVSAALIAAFDSGPPLEVGRDLLAIDRLGERDPDQAIAIFTSGGINRSAEFDFLNAIPEPTAWGLDPSVDITLRGVGLVPVPPGDIPSSALTGALLDYWSESCALHGPNCSLDR